jgi:tetratricopeptide (TPR) repeat protein
VTAPAFLAAGLLAGSVRSPRRGGRWSGTVALLALAGVVSITFPWLAARKVDAAYEAIGRSEFERGASDASSADDLNPFSVDPLWAWAGAESARGDELGALHLYERAAIRQPENSSTWYELGAFEFGIGRFANACRHLDIAYSLDPYGPAGRKGGLLDQARQRLPNCPPKSS